MGGRENGKKEDCDRSSGVRGEALVGIKIMRSRGSGCWCGVSRLAPAARKRGGLFFPTRGTALAAILKPDAEGPVSRLGGGGG
jgi:hypothetical protein